MKLIFCSLHLFLRLWRSEVIDSLGSEGRIVEHQNVQLFLQLARFLEFSWCHKRFNCRNHRLLQRTCSHRIQLYRRFRYVNLSNGNFCYCLGWKMAAWKGPLLLLPVKVCRLSNFQYQNYEKLSFSKLWKITLELQNKGYKIK